MAQFVLGANAQSAPGASYSSDFGQTAVIIDPTLENCWVFAIHMFGGIVPGTGTDTVTGMLWGGYDAPSRLVATNAIVVTTEFSGSAGGQVLEPAFAVGGTGYNGGSAWPLGAGEALFAGVRTTFNRYKLGYRPTEDKRELIAGNPSDVFAVAIRRNDVPALLVAIFCEGNRQPNTPTSLSPATGATIVGTAPTFLAFFSDADTAYGDYLAYYHIQLLSFATNTLVWDRIYSSEPGERANNAVNRAYEGSPLVAGQGYAWRVRMADHFATWGLWSNQTVDGAGNIVENAYANITIAGAGSATLSTIDGVASGKIESYTPALAGTYTHAATPALAMAQLQARVFQGINLVQTSAAIAKAVTSGGSWTSTWAALGLTALQPGLAYTVQTRALDSAGAWGGWLPTPGRAVAPNARPATPANLTPSANQPFSQRPEIRFLMTDIDDTVATGLVTDVEITRPDGTVITRAATLVAGTTDTWAYLTLAADITIYGTYLIRARGRDGTIDGFWSAPAAFRYLEGPTVTITAPTAGQTLASNQPTITWSAVTNQAGYQVFIFVNATNELVLDTGYRASTTALSYIPPSGVLHDNTTYRASVWSTRSDTLTGYADRVFTVDYPTGVVLPNARGSVFSARLDGKDTTAAYLSWEKPTASISTFWQYVVESEEQGKPETRRVLAQIPSINQVAYTDYEPRSGVVYIYRVWWEEIQGTDIRPSVVAEFTLTVNLRSTVIHLTDRPETARVHIPYYEDRGFTIDPTTTYVPTWAGTLPTAVAHPSTNESVSIRSRLVKLPGEPAVRDTLDKLESLVYEQSSDGVKRPRLETVCVRTPRGDRVYGVIEKLTRRDDPASGGSDISLDVTLTDYRKPLSTG